MAEIAEIVEVTITTTPSPVTQEGFGVGLILGAHLKSAARYETFLTLAALAAVHGTTSEIYKAASKYFGQSPAPQKVAVGRRQADTVTLVVATATDGATYNLVINGQTFNIVYSDSTPTVAEVATAIRSAINAASGLGAAATGTGANVIITNSVAGTALTVVTSDAKMTQNALTAAGTIADDLTAIQTENGDWYGLVLTDRASADAQAAIAWLASTRRLLFCATQEANARTVSPGSDSATLPAILKANTQDRSAVVYLGTAGADYPDAAVMGRVLPFTPGTYTAKFKSLTGITPSSLTSTEAGNLQGKNCNIYETIAGRNMLREGVVSSGKYIDQIHARDCLMARIEEAVFSAIADPDKVPYTDAGVAMVDNALKGVLQAFVDIGYLASYTTNVPKVANVSVTNKGNRLLPDVRFTAVEAGAIHKVQINGTISV